MYWVVNKYDPNDREGPFEHENEAEEVLNDLNPYDIVEEI